jgi:peptidoglycan/xylan/chitin deacetylase (PgdA/CDA1 family)
MQSPIPYSALIDRPPLRWPDNARVAFWVQVNLESFEFDRPGIALAPTRADQPIPDVNNAGWRDYGVRVGVWRMMEVLDRYDLRSSTPTNSDVCLHFPEIIREAQKRHWEFMGHAITNSHILTGLPEDREREVIRTSLEALTTATGQRPRGWLGPGLAQTFRTNDLLAEAGLEYVSDWCNDDQPYPIEVRSGRLIGVPYCKDIGDIPVFVGAGQPAERWYQMLCDQFDVLYDEGARSGRIYGLAIHPFISGVPFRSKWLDKALAYITGHDRVWITTAAEIADWYYRHYYDEALAAVRQRRARAAGGRA